MHHLPREGHQHKTEQVQTRKREATTTGLTTDMVNSQRYLNISVSTHHPVK